MCDEKKILIEPAGGGIRLIIFNLREVLRSISRDKTPPNLPGLPDKD